MTTRCSTRKGPRPGRLWNYFLKRIFDTLRGENVMLKTRDKFRYWTPMIFVAMISAIAATPSVDAASYSIFRKASKPKSKSAVTIMIWKENCFVPKARADSPWSSSRTAHVARDAGAGIRKADCLLPRKSSPAPATPHTRSTESDMVIPPATNGKTTGPSREWDIVGNRNTSSRREEAECKPDWS